MKKKIAIALIVVVLLIASVYIFISPQLTVSKIVFANTSIKAANRLLSDKTRWISWWPDSITTHHPAIQDQNRLYTFKDYNYQVDNVSYNKVTVRIRYNDSTINSAITLFPVTTDSIAIEWKCALSSGLNPLQRIQQYRRALDIKEKMTVILSKLQSFLAKKENIYGIKIEEVTAKDSTLIATKFLTTAYPAVAEIYRSVNDLKKYIAQEGALETNYPMLNVRKINDTQFETRVAIPTNIPLKGNARFFLTRFLPWKILKGTIPGGGNYTIEEALHQLQVYMEDYDRIGMAIPFQSLVTDRSSEPDTTKWTTNIYVPVS